MVSFVDDEDSGMISFTGLGYCLYFPGIFSVVFSEEYEYGSEVNTDTH